MLQPAGKCPNVWTFAQLNPSQIPSNMAPLLRPKGILRAFQSAVHSPRGKACLAAETILANSRVLAGPRAHTFLISPIQSEMEGLANKQPLCSSAPVEAAAFSPLFPILLGQWLCMQNIEDRKSTRLNSSH